MNEKQSPVPQAVVEGVAGALGGCVATILTYPLMIYATRQASRTYHKKPLTDTFHDKEKDTSTHDDDDDHDDDTTTSQVPREVWKEMQGLYSGLGASLFGTTVSQGVYFYFYSVLRGIAINRRKHNKHEMELRVGESLAIASLAGMTNVLVTNPIWVVATRMQTYRSLDPRKEIGSPNIVSVMKSIFHEYGLGGFWNGVGASLIMVINPTIQYAIYEWLMAVRSRIATKTNRLRRPSTLQVFAMSAIAKAGATVLTYPMLTVKTRMMSARKEDADIQYASILHAVSQILRNEGIGGYYRGMNTKITQSILGAAILLVCKERMTDISTSLLNGRVIR